MPFARFRALGSSTQIILVVAACLGLLSNRTHAAPPLRSLIPFERIDADPSHAYPLAESNGPWLIMVTTMQGPKAEENARALVYELRKNYKLNAYTHQMTFDHTGNIAGRTLDRFGQQQRMRNSHGGTREELAVLVGDFNSVDDPQLKRTLEKIKGLRPQALEQGSSAAGRAFDRLRDEVLPANARRKTQGPLRLAFVTTNPLLPEGYYQPKGVDSVVVGMNRDVEYSLLDNPGQYTIRVATFAGNVVMDPKRLKEIEEDGKEMKSRLIEAAQKAHEVTVFLRAKGFEAYEYHDRHSSIVTVGNYQSPGQINPDGSMVYSPEVQAKIDRFRAKPRRQPNGTMGPVTPERIETLNIYLDPNPIVIEVPRRSFGSDYARSMAGQ
jgi:hypothetical protein